ncbi:MAG: cytochrome c [Myxococcales bacterium]|nr:MAG: cytochrome c [Myxococcales bacterium]
MRFSRSSLVCWVFGACCLAAALSACGHKSEQSSSKAASKNKTPEALAELDLMTLEAQGAFKTLQPVDIDVVNDPAYHGGRKRFRGYALLDLLSVVPQNVLDGDDLQLRFHAADGYMTSLDVNRDLMRNAVVAYEDLEAPEGKRWVNFRKGKRLMTPAPFYLVWKSSHDDEKLPWPYQLLRIELVNGNVYDAAFPYHEERMTPGYTIFKTHCMSCHSINLAGGSLGPELNVPLNVTEYLDLTFIRAYIQGPRSFRARSVMPDFNELSAQEMKQLMDYLTVMRESKVCSNAKACERQYDSTVN